MRVLSSVKGRQPTFVMRYASDGRPTWRGRAYCDLAAQMAARNVLGSAVEEAGGGSTSAQQSASAWHQARKLLASFTVR